MSISPRLPAMGSVIIRPMPLRLIITGLPHSGTGYISQVLTHAGLPCGHEEVYGIPGIRDPGILAAESSWVATVHLDKIPEDVAIVHQVREPMAWLNSYVRAPGAQPTIERVLPGFSAGMTKQPVTTAMLLWTTWGSRISGSGRISTRYRLEEIDTDRVISLAEIADCSITRHAAEIAIGIVPRTYNTHPKWDDLDYVPLTWDDLPPGAARDGFVAMAREYGYAVP